MMGYSRRGTDLNILRVSLESRELSTQGLVVFELLFRGQSVARAEVSCEQMGLPGSFSDLRQEYRFSEPNFHIPDEVIDKLRAAIAGLSSQEELLWLELNPPGSGLTLVPWERLLQPSLEVKLLRLSFFPESDSFPRWDSLDVVLCASAPLAKGTMPVEELVSTLVACILEVRKVQTTVHVFTDKNVYRNLKHSLAQQINAGDEHGVRLYDPITASGYEPAERARVLRDEPKQVTNPWLVWMMDSLAGQTIDLVQFICHGFIYTDQGALALAESPLVNEDRRWARFVGARQLNAFLDRIGAYSLVFSSPPHNFSKLGLRILTEQIARFRPGIATLHDIVEDPEFKDLRATYLALYSDDIDKLPRSRAISLYCSPKILEKSLEKGFQYPPLLDGQSRGLPGSPSPPLTVSKEDGAWVASGLRWLERTASQIGEANEAISEAQSAKKEGAEEALKFVSDAIKRYGLKDFKVED